MDANRPTGRKFWITWVFENSIYQQPFDAARWEDPDFTPDFGSWETPFDHHSPTYLMQNIIDHQDILSGKLIRLIISKDKPLLIIDYPIGQHSWDGKIS